MHIPKKRTKQILIETIRTNNEKYISYKIFWEVIKGTYLQFDYVKLCNSLIKIIFFIYYYS